MISLELVDKFGEAVEWRWESPMCGRIWKYHFDRMMLHSSSRLKYLEARTDSSESCFPESWMLHPLLRFIGDQNFFGPKTGKYLSCAKRCFEVGMAWLAGVWHCSPNIIRRHYTMTITMTIHERFARACESRWEETIRGVTNVRPSVQPLSRTIWPHARQRKILFVHLFSIIHHTFFCASQHLKDKLDHEFWNWPT